MAANMYRVGGTEALFWETAWTDPLFQRGGISIRRVHAMARLIEN